MSSFEPDKYDLFGEWSEHESQGDKPPPSFGDWQSALSDAALKSGRELSSGFFSKPPTSDPHSLQIGREHFQALCMQEGYSLTLPRADARAAMLAKHLLRQAYRNDGQETPLLGIARSRDNLVYRFFSSPFDRGGSVLNVWDHSHVYDPTKKIVEGDTARTDRERVAIFMGGYESFATPTFVTRTLHPNFDVKPESESPCFWGVFLPTPAVAEALARIERIAMVVKTIRAWDSEAIVYHLPESSLLIASLALLAGHKCNSDECVAGFTDLSLERKSRSIFAEIAIAPASALMSNAISVDNVSISLDPVRRGSAEDIRYERVALRYQATGPGRLLRLEATPSA